MSIQGLYKEKRSIESVKYSEKELEYRAKLIQNLDNAKNQRTQKWVELDDMDYETWYWQNKKASESYIEPKQNEEDVKVVTGTTREKGNMLIATLLNYNLEADITAFDNNDTANDEIGRMMEAMVRKSRTLEMVDYELKRPLIYKELVNQGTVVVEEQYLEYSIPEKEIEALEWSEGIDPKGIEWKENINKVFGHCDSNMICGLDVFYGNMRQFFMELQPYMVIRRRISRQECDNIYKNWVRYKYVPYEMGKTVDNDDRDYNDYQMIQTEVDFVEEIKYYNKWTNEFMILLNGVMMMPVKFPLSSILGISEYPLAKGDSEPISMNFAISRGVGSKTKMDQAIMDEMFKMMIVKTRKSFKPPMSNRTQFTIGPEIYIPGKIFKGIDPEKITPIGEHEGVTPAEFNMIQFVKGIIDQNTISPLMEGQTTGGVTAREVIEQKKQGMIKIGMPMLGVINLEKRMAWLRIYNILRRWTKPIDSKFEDITGKIKNEYMSIDVEDEFENGKKGRRVIEMTDEILPESSQVEAEEDIIKHFTGEDVRKTYVNPNMLRALKYKWFVNIEPTEKNTGMLKAARFEEFVGKMMQIFKPVGKIPNMDYVGDRMALLNDENPEKIWGKQQPQGGQNPMAQLMAQAGGQQGESPIAAQMNASQAQGQSNLSMNTMANQ